MRAMLSGLANRLPGARFMVLHQFDNPSVSCVSTAEEVEYLPLRLSMIEALRLAVASALLWLGVPARRLAGEVGRQILDAYEGSDIVVSAPGGPYFGDLYADHEAVHWFFVWLGRLHHLPLALYAPSAGPFTNRMLNPLRRRGFRWFDVLALREERSAALLRDFLPELSPVVTADSALQEDPVRFREIAGNDRDNEEAHNFLIVAALRDPGAASPEHDGAVVGALEALAKETPTRVVLLPQVHGRRRDLPYLEALARRLADGGVQTTVADEETNSDQQRAIVATADLVLAGRYHPAVFAVAAEVPVLVLPYEHKAHGLAEAANIRQWALDVTEVTSDRLCGMLLKLHADREEVRQVLAVTSRGLRQRSARTSDLVADLVSRAKPPSLRR